MQTFIAQLNQLFTSGTEDSWLAGLCDVLRSHTGAWVYITGRGGRIIAESLPSNGLRPSNNDFIAQRPIMAGTVTLGQLNLQHQDMRITTDQEQMLDMAGCICTILMHQQERHAQSQRRQRIQAVREAINALSFSELEAAVHISQAITGLEGRMVAGHVADRLGFTRSIVVSALKKLEGAGIIETRSLGVKGTYIKIREPLLVEELGKLGI